MQTIRERKKEGFDKIPKTNEASKIVNLKESILKEVDHIAYAIPLYQTNPTEKSFILLLIIYC